MADGSAEAASPSSSLSPRSPLLSCLFSSRPPSPAAVSGCEAVQGYPTDLFLCPVDDEFVCPICLCVCRDAVTSPCCARLLCSRCSEAWLDRQSSDCPACGSALQSGQAVLVNSFADRRIRSLPIRCPRGCQAAGLVIGVKEKALTEHLAACAGGCSTEQDTASPLSPPFWHPSRSSESGEAKEAALSSPVSARPIVVRDASAAIALFDYSGECLSFRQGDVISLRQSAPQDDWWSGQAGGQCGLFPRVSRQSTQRLLQRCSAASAAHTGRGCTAACAADVRVQADGAGGAPRVRLRLGAAAAAPCTGRRSGDRGLRLHAS